MRGLHGWGGEGFIMSYYGWVGEELAIPAPCKLGHAQPLRGEEGEEERGEGVTRAMSTTRRAASPRAK